MAKPPVTTHLPTSAPAPAPKPTTVAPPKPPTSVAPPPATKTTVVAPPVQHTTTSIVALLSTSTDIRPTSTFTTIGNSNIANESGSGGGGGMGGAAIGGMVAGVVVILVGSVVGGFMLLKQRRKRMMMSGRSARNYNGYPDPDFGSGRVVGAAAGSGSGLGIAPPMPSFRRESGSRPRSAYSAHSRAGSSNSRHSGYGLVPPPPLPTSVRGRVNVESGIWDEKQYGNSNAAMVTRRVSSIGANGYVQGEYYAPGPGVPAGESSYSQLTNGMFVANGRRGEGDLHNLTNGESKTENESDPTASEKEQHSEMKSQDRQLEGSHGDDGSDTPAAAVAAAVASSVSAASGKAPASSLGPHPLESRPLGAAVSAYANSYHTQNGGYYQPGHSRPYSQMYSNQQQHPYAPRPGPPPTNRPMTPSGGHGPYPPPLHHFQQQHPYYPSHNPYGPAPPNFRPQQRPPYSNEMRPPYPNEMQGQGLERSHGPRRQPTYSSTTMSNDSSTVVDDDLVSSPTSQSPTLRSRSRQQQHPNAGNTLVGKSSQEPVMLLQDAQPLEVFTKEEVDPNQEKEPILPSMGEDIARDTPSPNGEKQEYVTIETNVVLPDKKAEQEQDRPVAISPPPLPIATKPKSIREF
ncbi:hypothetical protein EMPS_07913 [Entomortierella parvispora]|uniref:Uncharacterized protein n=1 Tax=Entomortierella parvispora TaxID=205924 RepID=A0A9P3HF17_9FUNG|nr:hypothetical protein EMPS_07913 [Entomortierella parvispora]